MAEQEGTVEGQAEQRRKAFRYAAFGGLGVAGLLLLIALMQFLFSLGGGEQAMEAGQRIRFELETGEIHGNQRLIDATKPADKPQEGAEAEKKENHAAEHTPPHAETSHTETPDKKKTRHASSFRDELNSPSEEPHGHEEPAESQAKDTHTAEEAHSAKETAPHEPGEKKLSRAEMLEAAKNHHGQTAHDEPSHEGKEEAHAHGEPHHATDGLEPERPKKTGLKPAPNPEMIEEGAEGPLPTITAVGEKPLDYYSRPFISQRLKKPLVAIVITGIGLSRAASDKAMALPFEVNMSISPYAADPADWLIQGREWGHETLIDLPMQPEDYPITDPGPYALLPTLTEEEMLERLEWIMSRGVGYVGLASDANEVFSASETFFPTVLEQLERRGVMLLYGRPEWIGNAGIMVEDSHAAVMRNSLLLDEKISSTFIGLQLERAEKLAAKQGYAVVIGRPYPVTIRKIEEWLRDIDKRPVELAPLSAVLRKSTG